MQYGTAGRLSALPAAKFKKRDEAELPRLSFLFPSGVPMSLEIVETLIEVMAESY